MILIKNIYSIKYIAKQSHSTIFCSVNAALLSLSLGLSVWGRQQQQALQWKLYEREYEAVTAGEGGEGWRG